MEVRALTLALTLTLTLTLTLALTLALTVWRCVPCGCDAIFCEPCPGCGASQPAEAMQAGIAALRPLLAAPPDRSGNLASDAFREGARACYILARSGVSTPASSCIFQLAEPDQLPALPAPVSDTVKDMRLRLGA